MIPFFRKLRKQLANDNKPLKYMRYAIGEIVLVVIGILIALQINNWNQDRLDAIERKAILINMNLEFKANRDQVLNDIEVNNNALRTLRILQDLIGADELTLHSNNLDSLIFNVLPIGSKAFPENTITELIQTGKRKYIENDSLKNPIFDWTHKLESVVFYFEQSLKRRDLLLSYLYKRYPLKSVDVYSSIHRQKPSKLDIDKLSIFDDIEFENLLEEYGLMINIFIQKENDLQNVIEQIIKSTESYN